MCHRRIDRVLGDVTLDAVVVIAGTVSIQRAALLFHLIRRLPGARDDLAHTAHRLRIARHHGENTHVMQHVLCRDGFRPNTAVRKGNILGIGLVEVVADHQHIQMLVDGVAGIRHGRVGRGRQNVIVRRCADNVRRVSAACALGVIGVDRAPVKGVYRVLDTAGLVERVRVNGHLHIVPLRDRQTAVDGGRRAAPVLVQLESGGTGLDLLGERTCG